MFTLEAWKLSLKALAQVAQEHYNGNFSLELLLGFSFDTLAFDR
jgi:hypothetical protein